MVSRLLQDRITLIPIDKLETWRSGNVRKSNVFDDIEDLAKNIQENGLLVPLLVVKKPDSDDKYWVISGQRRLEACRLIEYGDVECIELKNVNEEQAKLLSLSENLYRLDMNPDDISEAVDFLYRKYQDISRVAKKLGVSNSAVRRYIRYLQVPKALKDLVAQKKITASQAISIYVKFPDTERQIRIAKYLAKLNRPRKARTFRAIKNAVPTDDVRQIRRAEKRLRKMKKYLILLLPNTSDPIEKTAKAEETEPENVIVDILDNWVETRTRKGLPIVE